MKDEIELNTVQKSVTPSVLDAFNLVKDIKDDVKITGGCKVILSLRNNENEKDIQYAIKRLVRSLGANVPDMRTGYFATLVNLLKHFEQIKLEELINLVNKELHASGSSKSEVGDVALGQILVCGAIFRSGLMMKCSNEDQTKVIQLLLSASKKKSYLSTVAYLILIDFINTLNEDQFDDIVWSNVKQEFKKDFKEHNLDSLYFLIVVKDKFVNKVKLRKMIGVSDIFCADNIHDICEKVMAGIDFNSIGHPIFEEIGKQIANSPNLQLFWTSGIDSQLTKHNRNRELVAVNMLTTILNNMKDNYDVIPELLSRNFFKLFMDWFKGLQTASKIRNKRDNEDDHRIMIKKEKELLNALAKALKSEKVDDKIKVQTLKKLLINPGEMNFTDVTGTNVVKMIISDLKKDAVKKMAKLLKGVLLNTSKKDIKDNVERPWYNNERTKAAELLSYLVSHESVKEDTEFKLTYMKLLMCFGFFKISGDENIAVSSDLSVTIKSCFYRCFTSRFSNVDSLVAVLSSLSSFICNILKKEQVRTKIEKQFPKENMDCWEMLVGVCQNIETSESNSKVDKVFLILLYQLGLFLFSEPNHVKMARSSIKELKSCYVHYKKGKQKNKKLEGESEEEPEWIEVLIEVLLSILSIESSVLRSVVQCVFRLLWEYLTPSCIGQIMSVLDPESDTNPLSQDSESEESDNESVESEKENNDDGDEESESDDSEEEEEEDEDVNDNLKSPEQLRLAVQKALGAIADSDNDSIDADMIDDEEGKKLDEALAEAFKQYHQGKGKKATKKDTKTKKLLSDFRIRVLDLIDIYLEKDPAMDICLGMIAPLTRCIEFCIQDNQFKELENRVRKTIKNLTKIRKFSSTHDVTIDILCDYLKSTIDKGARSHFLYQAVGDIITHFTTFIIHCSQKIDSLSKSPKKKKKSPILQVLKDSLQSYFQNRNCLIPIIFFHNILQLDWDSNFELVPVIIENIFNNNVRQFRRNEGIELISGFYRSLKRIKPLSEIQMNKLISMETSFSEAMLNYFKTEEKSEFKNNFLVLLKKFINTVRGFHENCHTESTMDFKMLLGTVSSLKGVKNTNVHSNSQNQNQDVNGQSKGKKKKQKKRKLKLNGNSEPQVKKIRTNSHSE